jgi:hypothetical protein
LKSVMCSSRGFARFGCAATNRGPRVRSGAMRQNQPWRRGTAGIMANGKGDRPMPHATSLVLAAIIASSSLLVLAQGGGANAGGAGAGGDEREQRQR